MQPRYLVFALALASLGCGTSVCQEKWPEPKVLVDAKEATTSKKVLPARFGASCEETGKRKSSGPGSVVNRGPDERPSVLERMGAVVETVRIRSYRLDWKKDQVRDHVLKVLEIRSATGISNGPYWDEPVLVDIVATIQFKDKTEGVLEESRGHICFTTHEQSVLWLRAGMP